MIWEVLIGVDDNVNNVMVLRTTSTKTFLITAKDPVCKRQRWVNKRGNWLDDMRML